jgi:hypothetical protein
VLIVKGALWHYSRNSCNDNTVVLSPGSDKAADVTGDLAARLLRRPKGAAPEF